MSAQGTIMDAAGSVRVLFVDDEENILRALRRLFRREPWDIAFARSGSEALERFDRDGPYDVVVTDQRMPGMTGVQLLTELKHRHPDCIRIVLSGYTDVQTILDAVNQGAVYKFLTKPWEDGVLRDVVSDAVESVALRRQNEMLRAQVEARNAQLAAINRCLEEAIRQSLKARSMGLAQAVAEHAPAAIVAVASSGEVAFANRAARRLLAVERADDILGTPWEGWGERVQGFRVQRADGVRCPGWSGSVLWIRED